MAFLPTPPNPLALRQSTHLTLCTRRPANVHSRPPPPCAAAREASASEVEAVINENTRPLLLDAYATWCGPCQFLKPELDILSEKYGDRLDILKLDTEAYPDLATRLAVRGLPSLFFIKDGTLRYKMEGALTADQLEKYVDYILFDGPAPVSSETQPAAA